MNISSDLELLQKRIQQLEQENEQLKTENKRLFSAVEYSPATIVVTDLEGNIVFSNPGFTHITGYTREEALGLNPRLLKSNFHTQEFYKHLWETIQAGEVWQGVFLNKKKSGEFYWEQAHIAPIKDDMGVITHYVAIKFDITKKIESEQYLKVITSTIPELIFVMDEDGRYLDVMIADEEVLTYAKEKYIGKLIDEVMPESLASKLKEAITNAISQKTKQAIEYEIESSTGMVCYEARLAFLDIKINDKKCAIIIAHDITDRKKAEQDLMELNATKDKFFTILAHDLKNPFNAILTFSKMLETEMEQNTLEESKRLAKFIYTSSELAFDLLDNLLQWARSQTGRLEFRPQKFILSHLVENVVNLAEAQALNKKISVSANVPNNIAVFADLNLTKTILRNLISNAIKYTQPEGKITVEVEKIPGFAQVIVSDTGIGIPPQKLHKLFHIESVFSTLGTENERGTGLGLILCMEFVKLQGGTIWIESEEHKGSRVMFTIPS